MSIGFVAEALVGSLIAYILGVFLIGVLITGTTSGDTMMTAFIPIACATGCIVAVLRRIRMGGVAGVGRRRR